MTKKKMIKRVVNEINMVLNDIKWGRVGDFPKARIYLLIEELIALLKEDEII